MSRSPLISVIMSVHNGAQYLSMSIESILKQTISDFEFIIVDDGSTDSSSEIIGQYAAFDSRIVWWRREQRGLTKSLNEALGRARGIFIARQDADDISLPHRLQTMVDFLRSNPSIAAAGAWCEIINDIGLGAWPLKFPTDHDRISWTMIGCTAIVHPSAMIRQECIAQYGFYNEDYVFAQDYELWTRWIRLGARLANVPDVLLKYRKSSTQISTKHFEEQSKSAINCATVYINFLLSDNLRPQEIFGIRQLVGSWTIDANSVSAIPVVLRLLKLPRFKRNMRLAWRTRSLIAMKITMAIRKFGQGDRKRTVFGLITALIISPRVIVERNWWIGLLRQI